MAPPKYVESPNAVQTSLYGYDRHKKVQFQLNNLRGQPIVVLRSEPGAQSQGKRFCGNGSGPKKIWSDRINQMPVSLRSKQMFPSYTRFHHQYSCAKTSSFIESPPQNGPLLDHEDKIDRTPRRPSPPKSCRCSPGIQTLEEEMTVKRLFDKLEVPTPPTASTSNSACSKTLLELSSKVTANKNFTPASLDDLDALSISSSQSPVIDLSFLVDTPTSLSESRRSSLSINSRTNLDLADDSEETSSGVNEEEKKTGHLCPDESQCVVFRNGVCVDDQKEREEMLQWYDDLIQWRHDIITKKRFGPPRCHPAPLTITIIGASRAQRVNPFQRIGDVHPFALEAMDHFRRKMEARRCCRLIPAMLPLPAPHEFMANAKCMEPHLFVEYCYQLTAAAYIDTGLNPPHRRPPIPPRIEPMPEPFCRNESICSSASEISSDGEYSDDSEGTKNERLRLKMERHRKRECRLQNIFQRRMILDEIDEE